MEARLANIVHHMTGEADEDTMSAWGSLGSAGTPAEHVPSPGYRRSFLATQAPDVGVTPVEPVELHGKNDTGGSGESVNDDLTIGEVDIGNQVVPRGGSGRKQGGAGTSLVDNGDIRVSRLQAELDTADGDMRQGDGAVVNGVVNSGDAVVGRDKMEGESPPGSKDFEGTSSTHNGAIPSGGNGASADNGVVASPEEPRRGSNQDDQSDGSNSRPSSARGDAIVFETNNIADESLHLTNRTNQPRFLGLQESITSGGSDARHVARLRWIWAFGRVCQLIRRRKRKKFEVMSQRATDRCNSDLAFFPVRPAPFMIWTGSISCRMFPVPSDKSVACSYSRCVRCQHILR